MAHPSETKIEKALTAASAKIELAGVSSKENGNLDPFADPSARDPIDEAVHLFLKEAENNRCFKVVRSLGSHKMRLPQGRILNGFRAASGLTKAPSDRGIIPLTGMVMRSDLETERQKNAIGNEAKADVRERFPVTEIKEIADSYVELYAEREPAERLTAEIVGRTPELTAFKPLMTHGVMSGSLLPMVAGGIVAAAIITQAIIDRINARGKRPRYSGLQDPDSRVLSNQLAVRAILRRL